MTTEAYPLHWPDGWPRTSSSWRIYNSPFKTTFEKARRDLHAELARLGARHVVVSSHLPLRNDGMPRADAARRRIADPGVAVYFTLRDKQMVMARDAYETVHDNLRSICLAIQALRQLERHGGGSMLERAFEGFTALPAPAAPRDWHTVLGVLGGAVLTREDLRRIYVDLARKRHPDRGGSDAAMTELNGAYAAAVGELDRVEGRR